MDNLKGYAVIQDLHIAQSLIKRIEERKNFSGSWSQPIPHPTDNEYLILVDWGQLKGCEELFSGFEIISKKEAKDR